MDFFKCKMCGGDLLCTPGSSLAKCEYCGSVQTIPTIADDKKTRLYNRANQYRRDCEFDKAYTAYEAIVGDKPDEAEAYWGMLLSEYGVEYVDDPATGNKVPTCHRTLVQSVTSNANYKAAYQYADGDSRIFYEESAETLDALQKRVLNASAKEDPYDVFICYKESDDNGNRTPDSVLAEDIYDALTAKGMRVFFSRISLEDRLGQDYEPCIFAALSSAKIMLMVATDSDYCNAVWVKNEWKRYLNFMKQDPSKTLIPVFRDISPYALPDEFSKFQAQDMGKLGAMQDLIRGVEKLTGKTKSERLSKEEKQAIRSMQKTQSVLHNILFFVLFFILAAAQFVGLIVVNDMLSPNGLLLFSGKGGNVFFPFYETPFEHAFFVTFVYLWVILRMLYFRKKKTAPVVGSVLLVVLNLLAFRDGYVNNMSPQPLMFGMLALALLLLVISISGKVRYDKQYPNRDSRFSPKTRKIFGWVGGIVTVIFVLAVLAVDVLVPNITYTRASSLVSKGQYEEAVQMFQSLGDFKDSSTRVYDTYISKAEAYAESGDYTAAGQVLEETGLLSMGYANSETLKTKYIYLQGKQYHDDGNFESAISTLETVRDYEGAVELIADSWYQIAEKTYASGDLEQAISEFQKAGEYGDSSVRIQEITAEAERRAAKLSYEMGASEYERANYKAAAANFKAAGDYEDAEQRFREAAYQAGGQCMQNRDYAGAIEYYSALPGNSDAEQKLKEAKYRYCEAVKNNPNNAARSYIRELKNANYPGAANLANVIFAWKADVRIQVSLRVGTMTGVGFYAKLSGGDGTSTKVKFVLTVQGQTYNYCDDKLYKAGDEASCQFSHNSQDVTGFYYTVKAYDGSGKLIGSASGIPEDF